MPLLTSPDMLPEAMRFLVRALLAVGGGPVSRSELLGMVAPAGLVAAMEGLGGDYVEEGAGLDDDDEAGPTVDDDDELADTTSGKKGTGGAVIANQSLLALKMFGLVSSEKRQVSLSAEARSLWTKPADATPAAFREALLDIVFRLADPTARPGDGTNVNDLVQAVELVYTAENPLRPFTRFAPANSGRSFQELQSSVLGGDMTMWPVRNGPRWPAFCRWSFYLGLTGQSGDGGVIADASTALKIRLAQLPEGVYNAGSFVERCAEALPLLEGGALQRTFVPEVSGATRVLSPALSLSLLQMEADGVARFDKQSDVGVCVIRLRTDRTADREFTSVEWLPGAEDWSKA